MVKRETMMNTLFMTNETVTYKEWCDSLDALVEDASASYQDCRTCFDDGLTPCDVVRKNSA